MFTGGNKNVVVQLHPLLRHSPVLLGCSLMVWLSNWVAKGVAFPVAAPSRTFTYSFQMSRAAPKLGHINLSVARGEAAKLVSQSG